MDTFIPGDRVQIWITGQIGDYEATVIPGGTEDAPSLRITSDPSWSMYTLKPGDYIIQERLPSPEP